MKDCQSLACLTFPKLGGGRYFGFYFILFFFFPILGFRRLLLLAICLSFVAHLLLSLVALSLPLSAAGCFLLEYSRASHFISVVVTHASLKMHLPALAGV